MPKKIPELKPLQVSRLAAVDGFHNVGGVSGLHLQVRGGSSAWVLRATVGTRRRDIGLGGYPDVTLAQARDRARAARAQIDNGVDPVEAKRAARATLVTAPTFDWCAAQTIAAKRPEWKNAKHADQWANTLETYASPVIGALPVDAVQLPHVIDVLSPLWTSKTETATRLRARLEAVLAWATVSGYRRGDNPARWKGNLDAVLPKPRKVAKVQHHRALPADGLHGFMSKLRQREGMAARALEFLVLTATRSGEVRGATWAEVDLDARVWTVPAERMKAGKEHRVPLSDAALALLTSLQRMAGTDLVFPSPSGRMLSDMALSAVMRRMDVDAVPHGFRSTFRDWASERTNYPRDVAEMALAHAIGNKVEAAYRRGDLFAKRTHMMADWAKFVDTPPATGNVVPIRKEQSA